MIAVVYFLENVSKPEDAVTQHLCLEWMSWDWKMATPGSKKTVNEHRNDV